MCDMNLPFLYFDGMAELVPVNVTASPPGHWCALGYEAACTAGSKPNACRKASVIPATANISVSGCSGVSTGKSADISGFLETKLMGTKLCNASGRNGAPSICTALASCDGCGGKEAELFSIARANLCRGDRAASECVNANVSTKLVYASFRGNGIGNASGFST
jgi:hypothetical protein